MDFVKEIREGIVEVLTVSKVERDRFRFTRWEVEKYEDIVSLYEGLSPEFE